MHKMWGGQSGNVEWSSGSRGVMVVVVVVREVNSSKCFQSRPMVREVRRRRAMVKIVTSREVDVVSV